MLPLEHAGIMFMPQPSPVVAESGLAGGVVALRLDALEVVDGVNGSVVLVPKGSGRPRPGNAAAWCRVITAAPAVVDSGGRLGAEGWLPEHVRLGILESHLGQGTVESVVLASQVRQLSAGEEPVGRRQRTTSLELLVRLVLLLSINKILTTLRSLRSATVTIGTQQLTAQPRIPTEARPLLRDLGWSGH